MTYVIKYTNLTYNQFLHKKKDESYLNICYAQLKHFQAFIFIIRKYVGQVVVIQLFLVLIDYLKVDSLAGHVGESVVETDLEISKLL